MSSWLWCFVVLAGIVVAQQPALAEPSGDAELLERLRRLEENQSRLYELLKAKDRRLDALEAELERTKKTRAAGADAPPTKRATSNQAPVPAPTVATPAPVTPPEPPVANLPAPQPADDVSSTAPSEPPAQAKSEAESLVDRVVGFYQPGSGFALGKTEWGAVNFGIYTYLRYLNQHLLDDTFVNGLGDTVDLDKRNDVELNKAKIEFRGWLLDPKFRFVLYTWTNNAAQGQGAQVVVGGNLNWRFSDALNVGGGILSLPSTRSTQGNFPYWLTVDHRTIADEFFRASYSQGFFAYGIQHGFGYFGMLANNLSTLGVDAAQLDGDFSTFSGALWWMPTTGEFGPRQAFGDYEEHQDVATRLGIHFTFSPEDRQSQPGANDIDNTQIRLSNGTIIFTPGALAPGVGIRKVKYYMGAVDAGLKYKGFALEPEYYLRRLDDFHASGPLPVDHLFDHGFQVMASQMLLSKTLQAYTMGSYIFGEHGDSWETTFGLNYWPFNRRELRLNVEALYDHHSPIGYTAVPQLVGGTGWVLSTNLELSF